MGQIRDSWKPDYDPVAAVKRDEWKEKAFDWHQRRTAYVNEIRNRIVSELEGRYDPEAERFYEKP